MSRTKVSIQGEIMIEIHKMTKEEFDEYFKHNVLHDMSDVVLKYGYDEVMADLANILDNKLDKLEPVVNSNYEPQGFKSC